MNEMLMYEDVLDELKFALGGFVDDEVAEKLCEAWVRYLSETRAENCTTPTLVELSDDVKLPDGYEGSAYAIVADNPRKDHESEGRYRNATGFRDDPRLLFGRMFQVEDIQTAVFEAMVNNMVRNKKAIEDTVSKGGDPRAAIGAILIDSIPDLMKNFRDFMAKKKIERSDERAIALTAFSQYDVQTHAMKNEPFSAEAMQAWLGAAQGPDAKSMPPRVRDSIRAVNGGLWEPSTEEVTSCLRHLEEVGFLRPAEGSSDAKRLYCINI